MREAYGRVANKPKDKHPFPVGREFALGVGYPPELLDGMPASVVDAFTGVSCLSVIADIPRGVTVLDLGCGMGLDALIAARKVGRSGMVTGVDFSEDMIRGARAAAKEADIRNVEFICAEAEGLPIKSDSVDVVLVNGILNLNPHRDKVLGEVHRVLAPEGQAFFAELLLIEPAPHVANTVCDMNDWFS